VTLPVSFKEGLHAVRGRVPACRAAHNYVNLNIGRKLALEMAAAEFVQWTIVGIVIGLLYKPIVSIKG
jgi:hypothetical protein